MSAIIGMSNLPETRKLPQQLKLEKFVAVATITTLVNHGRQAEVFFQGESLGYVDALGVVGLRQAHKAEVNNALYANTPGASEFLARPLPSMDALAEYPELVSLHPEAAAMVQCSNRKLTEGIKIFQCTWGESYIEPRVKAFQMYVFTDATGYSAKDREAIESLSIGSSCWLSGVDISVMRLPDLEVSKELASDARNLPQQLTLAAAMVQSAHPEGWSESEPGGLATNVDPIYGGIVDCTIQNGEWFVVPHLEGLPVLEGFKTRALAFDALKNAIEHCLKS